MDTASLFDTLYFLQKNEYYKKIYFVSRFISCCLAIQTVFNYQYNWRPSYGLFVETVLGFLSFPVNYVTKQQFFVVFWIIVAVLAVSIVLVLRIARGVKSGSFQAYRSTKILRSTLGLVDTFAEPFCTILLVGYNCNWFLEPIYQSQLWPDTNCVTDWFEVLLLVLSAVFVFPFVFCVVISVLMHVNDPKSSMILSRAHSRVDLLESVAGLFLTALFVFFQGSADSTLAFLFLVFQLAIVLAWVIFQPYYHVFTNDLFSAFATAVLWSAICFVVLVAGGESNAAGAVASGLLFVGAIPFGSLGFVASRKWRNRIYAQTMAEYSRFTPRNSSEDNSSDLEGANHPSYTDAGIPYLSDDEVFPVIKSLYDINITTSVVDDIGAALVEIKTRFLIHDKSPRALDIAEHILKTGLLKYPQSGYLRIQYITFLISYRENFNLASIRMAEMGSVELDWDLRFSLLRKRRELERKKQSEHLGSEAITMDSITFEELKKRIRDARTSHENAIETSARLWKVLFRKLGGTKRSRKKFNAKHQHGKNNNRHGGSSSNNKTTDDRHATQLDDGGDGIIKRSRSGRVFPMRVGIGGGGRKSSFVALPSNERNVNGDNVDVQGALDAIAPMLESMQEIINHTDKEYELLANQCHDSKEVTADYARYLRNVKFDISKAEEMEERLNMLSQDNKDMRSQHSGLKKQDSASMTSKNTDQRRRHQHALITFREEKRSSKLKFQLQIVSAMMIMGCTGAFAFFYIWFGTATSVLINNNDFSVLRYSCPILAYELRSMQSAAIAGDVTSFNSSTSYLTSLVATYKVLHFNLLNQYNVDFGPRNSYLSSQSVNTTMRGSGGDGTPLVTSILLSPTELYTRYLSSVESVLKQPMATFAAFKASNPSLFPDFYFVLENAFACGRSMDTTVSMFSDQLDFMALVNNSLLICICAVVVMIEVFTVIVIFGPSINQMFDQFSGMMSRFANLPIQVIAELEEICDMRLKKLRVFNGDNEQDQLDLQLPTPLALKSKVFKDDSQFTRSPALLPTMHEEPEGPALEVKRSFSLDDASGIRHKQQTLVKEGIEADPTPSPTPSHATTSSVMAATVAGARLRNAMRLHPHGASSVGSNESGEVARGSMGSNGSVEIDITVQVNSNKDEATVKNNGSNDVYQGVNNNGAEVSIYPFSSIKETDRLENDDSDAPSLSGSDDDGKPFTRRDVVATNDWNLVETESPRKIPDELARVDNSNSSTSYSATPSTDANGQQQHHHHNPHHLSVFVPNPNGVLNDNQSPFASAKSNGAAVVSYSPSAQHRRGPINRRISKLAYDDPPDSDGDTTSSNTPRGILKNGSRSLNRGMSVDSAGMLSTSTSFRARAAARVSGLPHALLKNRLVRQVSKHFALTEEDDHDKEKEDESQQRSRRKLYLVLTYYALMFCIAACATAFATTRWISMIQLSSSSYELDNAGRHRYLFEYAIFWAREIQWSKNASMSLMNGTLSLWGSESTLRSLLYSTASTSLMVHYSLLYGLDYGFQNLPVAMNLNVDPVFDPYSPLTRDPDLFQRSTKVSPIANSLVFANFMFNPGCLTSPNDIGSYVISNPRLVVYYNMLSDSLCVYYLWKDAAAISGMHTMVAESSLTALRLATASVSSPTKLASYTQELNSLLKFASSTSDMNVGLVKLVLLSLQHSLAVADLNNLIMIVLYMVVMGVVIVRYLVLRKKVEKLMRGNLAIILTMDTLLAEAAKLMIRDGYDLGELAHLVAIEQPKDLEEDGNNDEIQR